MFEDWAPWQGAIFWVVWGTIWLALLVWIAKRGERR